MTATLLSNGKVLVIGGYGNLGALASTEIDDPASGLFSPGVNLFIARDLHTVTLLNNGTLLVTGGQGITGTDLNSAELYDPDRRRIQPNGEHEHGPPLPQCQLATQRHGVGHGWIWECRAQLSFCAEIYDPASGTFSLTGIYQDLVRVSRDSSASCAYRPEALVASGARRPNLPERRRHIYMSGLTTINQLRAERGSGMSAWSSVQKDVGESAVRGHSPPLSAHRYILMPTRHLAEENLVEK